MQSFNIDTEEKIVLITNLVNLGDLIKTIEALDKGKSSEYDLISMESLEDSEIQSTESQFRGYPDNADHT